MSDHIKAPWVPCYTGKPTVRESVGGAVVAIIANKGPMLQALARRDLIAAAPDLLAFARRVASTYDETYSPFCQERIMGDEARTVIAKAEGRS